VALLATAPHLVLGDPAGCGRHSLWVSVGPAIQSVAVVALSALEPLAPHLHHINLDGVSLSSSTVAAMARLCYSVDFLGLHNIPRDQQVRPYAACRTSPVPRTACPPA
jgi:hypothetical protein